MALAYFIAQSLLLSSESRLGFLERPEDSLERLVTRELDLQAALKRVPAWEEASYVALFGDTDLTDLLDDAIRWYDELVREFNSSEVQLYRVILLAEAGQGSRVRAAVMAWQFQDELARRHLIWVRAAFLGEAPDPGTGRALLQNIQADLPPGWFADTLMARIAAAIGDRETQIASETSIAARGEVLLHRRRAIAVGEVLLLAVGLLLLWRIWLARAGLPVAEAPLPPPWPFRDGYGLFIRGAVAFVVINGAISFYSSFSSKGTVLVGVLTLVAGMPMLWWTTKYLAARGMPAPLAFGLRPVHSWTRTVTLTLGLLGLSLVGEMVIGLLAVTFHIKTDWTDGFLEDVLWGPAWVAAGQVIDTTVWAPLVEEIAFRGLLYGTLRTRMSAWPAALLNAGVFALVHGYGITGFASVYWSGLLWSLAYERTRSLWPGILAHAGNNLLVALEFIWLVRM